MELILVSSWRGNNCYTGRSSTKVTLVEVELLIEYRDYTEIPLGLGNTLSHWFGLSLEHLKGACTLQRSKAVEWKIFFSFEVTKKTCFEVTSPNWLWFIVFGLTSQVIRHNYLKSTTAVHVAISLGRAICHWVFPSAIEISQQQLRIWICSKEPGWV